MKLGIVAALASGLLLGGCGNPPSNPATPGAASSSSTTTTTSTAVTRRLTQQQLEATLLSVKDLPSGWSRERKTGSTTTTTTTTASADTPGLCGSAPQAAKSKEKANRSFVRGGGLTITFANVQIAQFESPDAAKAAWAPAVKLIADCTSWTDPQGTNWTVAEMSAPKLGDDSTGVRMQQKSGTAVIYLVRTGPGIVMVTGAGLTDVPTTELEMLLNAQVTSYQAALPKQQ